MNNKRLGTEFERELCELLAKIGYWVHFISPDRSGAQPFDIIAVKKCKAYAIDCKTCESDVFNISRLEDNQIFAFERWLRCENTQPIIAIKHKGDIKILYYEYLKEFKSVKISELSDFKYKMCGCKTDYEGVIV